MQKIVVRDVGELKRYAEQLRLAKKEMERIYAMLLRQCAEQKNNWDDPQYVLLQRNLNEFTGMGKRQLTRLEESASYISGLVRKLESI